MNPNHIFISHASKDDEFVKELRLALEAHQSPVWVDSRKLRGGAKLAPEINEAIEQARHVIVVLSSNTVNSPWLRKEIAKALEVEQQRKDEGYRVIPLLLPGIERSALPLWFDEEPVGVRVELKTGGVSEALPQILAALGERLPTDHQPLQSITSEPVEELLLKLSDPQIQEIGSKRRAVATATLVYEPADQSARAVESKRFTFTAPLGPIEADDLRWYLESYHLWPTGVFQKRAERIEEQLPHWGQDLYKAALATQSKQAALTAWQHTPDGAERCFSVFIDSDLPEGTNQEDQATAREAASQLLSLPWELLHDGRDYLFQGGCAVYVRRRLPNRQHQPILPTRLPIRILLVSPRPEDERTGYIDHRISAKPLMDAVDNLGDLVTLTVLVPPTFSALQQALQRAKKARQPFDVVHFDGHGVYDREHGLGGLCFEDPKDAQKLERRAMQFLHAEKLAGVMRDYRIPLVFLEACQSAKTEEDPTASVAAKLLDEGVVSVVAMSHSVLVETAHRFVKAFYSELARGVRVGTAMLAGQQALYGDTYRGKIMGAGELHLQDWFVPVLYQEEQDPQLITKKPPKEVQQLQAKQRRLNLGNLPDPPPHHFLGRSRELLVLERLLHNQPYAVVCGQGGAGKTTLAVELARWLVRTNHFRHAAFVSLEQYTDARGVLDELGRQLLPEGDNWSVAQYPDLKQALQSVERALGDHPTIIVLDNIESVLPGNFPSPLAGEGEGEGETFQAIAQLCQHLLHADPATRLVFTSRESLPEPFNHKHREIGLGALSRGDAKALVSHVLAQEGLIPNPNDPGDKEADIIELVESVNRHARALILLAPELAFRGVRATTENLHQIMAELHKKHPGDRENSLYASVELSLRRLPMETQEQVKALAVFHGGAHLVVLRMALETDYETVKNLAAALIEVGLAETMDYGHLRLDPGLPPYLLGQMDTAEREVLQSRWAAGMQELTAFLYQQLSQDTQLAAQLTLLELPNLLTLLAWAAGALTPEEVVGLAVRVEVLLARLGRPQALALAFRAREAAARRLGEWSHAQYLSAFSSIDRLLEQGKLPAAYAAAQQLLQRCLSAGAEAYPEASYDISLAHWSLGRVLKTSGAAEEALPPLAEAQQRFQLLADTGDTSAELTASKVITEIADCLHDLGRYDEAAANYEEGIRRAEKLGDRRGAAVGKGQLGTVRFYQKRYAEALDSYAGARKTFESLGEPGSVATALHQIGIVHRIARQFGETERAYKQALAIRVQQKNLKSSEASSLTELGNLYDGMGRLEEAVTFYRQAVDIYAMQDLRHEGVVRSNLAATLIKLHRFEEARPELQRAIECKKPFGHVAEPWRTWAILHNLEQATGHPQAAAEARRQTIESYASYRRAGGASQSNVAELYDLVIQAIQQGTTAELEQQLAELSEANDPPWFTALLAKLHAILRGSRDPALADNPDLDSGDAAELQLLLERLSA